MACATGIPSLRSFQVLNVRSGYGVRAIDIFLDGMGGTHGRGKWKTGIRAVDRTWWCWDSIGRGDGNHAGSPGRIRKHLPSLGIPSFPDRTPGLKPAIQLLLALLPLNLSRGQSPQMTSNYPKTRSWSSEVTHFAGLDKHDTLSSTHCHFSSFISFISISLRPQFSGW